LRRSLDSRLSDGSPRPTTLSHAIRQRGIHRGAVGHGREMSSSFGGYAFLPRLPRWGLGLPTLVNGARLMVPRGCSGSGHDGPWPLRRSGGGRCNLRPDWAKLPAMVPPRADDLWRFYSSAYGSSPGFQRETPGPGLCRGFRPTASRWPLRKRLVAEPSLVHRSLRFSSWAAPFLGERLLSDNDVASMASRSSSGECPPSW